MKMFRNCPKTLQFSLEKIVKGIVVRMAKRKPTNSVLSFDDVLNDVNDWLAEENGENDEIDEIVINCAVK